MPTSTSKSVTPFEAGLCQSGSQLVLSKLAFLLPISVLILIFFGALVKSHNAGLAVPDWPTSFGENMFLFPPSKWQGLIFYEHVHRLIASAVGFLTMILAFWLTCTENSRAVKILAWSCLLVVIAQGVLGGLTVLYLLPDEISIAHGVLAQTFLVLTIILAFTQTREWREHKTHIPLTHNLKFFRLGLIAIGLVWAQLVLGAIMRHTESGLAILDFPTMGGALFPILDGEFLAHINSMRKQVMLFPVSMNQVLFHLAHRVSSIIVLAFFAALLWHVLRKREELANKVRRNVYFISFLVVAQFTLGVLTVFSLKHPVITSMHVLGGALLLATCTVLAIRGYLEGK